MERINDFKARGNAALKAGNLAEAADMYTNALAVYGASQSFVDASVVSIVYANRSMTRLRQDRPEEALEDANQSICFNPQYNKAHFRKHKSLLALGRAEEAATALRLSKLVAKLPFKDAIKAERKIARRVKQQEEAGAAAVVVDGALHHHQQKEEAGAAAAAAVDGAPPGGAA